MDQQPMQPVQMQPQPMMQQAPQMVMAAGFSHKSQQMVCPLCHENIATRVEFRACTKTHIIAGLLCFFCGCCCGCCCPYCCDGAKEASHSCPKCNGFIGSHEP